MTLKLIHGRKATTGTQGTGQSNSSFAIARRSSWSPLLVNARHLSQEIVTTNKRPIDVVQLLRYVYRRFLPIAQMRRTFLFLHPLPRSFVVEGKPVALAWAFSTLVDYVLNDTSARGEVMLSVSLSAETNRSVTISSFVLVRPLTISRTVDAKVRASQPNKIGLTARTGFAIATAVIEAHGGCITVEDDRHHGATVTIAFPQAMTSQVDTPVR